MKEKLLLAVSLTFALHICAETSLLSANNVNLDRQDQPLLVVLLASINKTK